MFNFKKYDLLFFIKYINYFNINNVPMQLLDQQYIDYEFAYDFVNSTCRLEYLNESNQLIYEDYTNSNGRSFSVNDVIENLKSVYKIKDYQFKVFDPNNVVIVSVSNIPDFLTYPNSILIPLINKNIEIMDTEFKHAGYYHAANKQYTDSKGRKWINIVYDPIVQETITMQVRKHTTFIYHCSPAINDESIMQNGFVPKNEKRVYNFYQPRVYFHSETIKNEHVFNMLKKIHHNRKRKNPKLNNDYYVYALDVEKIPENVEFFLDPHAIKAIYAIEKIPYDVVIKKFKMQII